MKNKVYKVFSTLLLTLLLASCGGGTGASNNNLIGSDNTDGINSSLPQQLEAEQIAGGFQTIGDAVFSEKSTIQAVINSVSEQNITANYSVNAYKIEYLTRDTSNALVKVSGLIAIPEKSTASPVISFQHGTLFLNKEAPSFHLTPDDKNPEIALASLGYIVFSADYIGYGSSSGREHPYLQQQASADVVNDLLRAGKIWLDSNKIKTTTQLFMTGYSQGGYVTMAALKALQESPSLLNGLGFEVSGAVMAAGPYDLHTALSVLSRGIQVPDALVNIAIDLLEKRIVSAGGDVKFERTFLERFFTDDRQDDVHDWKPNLPIKLFHGEEDKTVPIESAESTVNTMQALGADIELVKCSADRANHRHCIFPYVNYMVDYFDGLRTDSR